MKPGSSEKIGQGFIMGVCFTAYIFLVGSVLAAGFDLSFYFPT